MTMHRSWHKQLGWIAALAVACGDAKDADVVLDPGLDSFGSDDGGSTGEDTVGPQSTTGIDGDGDDGDGEGGPDSPVKFDFGIPDAPDGIVCGAPSSVTCDHMSNDPWNAIGLNCPGGPQVNGVYNGSAQALYVHEGNLGTYVDPVDGPPFPPREGSKFVIMSSGIAQELTVAGLYASTNNPDGLNPGNNLPAPLRSNDVSATEDCTDNPGLVGMGDCSNTINGQWTQGSGAYDYAEMRFNVTVPAGTTSMSYDLAMFSTEYPVFYKSSFNDMYIAWLESEQWTGNISFDEQGNPISLNAGFLDYKDAPNSHDCPAPCTAPELQGTAMEGHAGTKWLTTTAPVTPLEDIEVVFAVFDLSDSILDTVVLIDNFEWGCEGGPPLTIPG
jgi:hypothetical protein